MAVAQTQTPLQSLTYEQYLREYQTEIPTNQRYDIIDGRRIFAMTPAPRLLHQEITANIMELLRQFRRMGGGGHAVSAPLDLLIRQQPLRTRQPDVLFISNERYEQNGGRLMEGPLRIAPELVVEILSPSETPRSIRDKVEDFRGVGVQECWIVSPDAETVEVLRLNQEEIETVAVYAYSQTLRSIVFPDLVVSVADLFME